MRISELMRDRFGLAHMGDALRHLDGLAGRQIGLHVFYDGAEGIQDGQTAAYLLSRYFLPIADFTELTVGLHLLPAYVARQRFAVARYDPESERLIDHAPSLPAYVHRSLLESEAEDEDVDEDSDVAREIFGGDFYSQPYDQLPSDSVERTMIDTYGGAAVDYRELAWFAGLRKSADEQIDWLEEGAQAAPECMYFHRVLARRYAEQGDKQTAAYSFARSLECYHHTACGFLDEAYYALGRELLEEVPTAFTDLARRDLTLEDGEARMAWLVSLFKAGDLETSVKLLSDFRYDSRTDLHPGVFEFLRLHYRELGWAWALAWCDLCAVDERQETGPHVYRGRPLPAGWDRPVQQAVRRQP